VLVVPCFNERARLDADAFVRFVRGEPDVSLLFVDDGSTDGTDALLAALRDAEPGSISVVRLERNSGKAEAVRRGMLRAFEEGAAYAGYWDADLATPLDAFTELREALERDETLVGIIGSRVRLLGRTIERHAVRHYVGRVLATVASLALDLPVYDTQCGAKLFRRTPATVAAFAQPFRGRWTFDVELLARLKSPKGGAIAVEEHPLRAWRDIGGSKIRVGDGLVAVHELLALWARERWRLLSRRARPGRVAPSSVEDEATWPSLKK